MRRVTAGAAAALTLVPFLAAFVGWRTGWMPISDWATIVTRSWDSLSKDPPLVGIYSSATTTGGVGHVVYHPGPLQEWLLSVPIHAFAPSTVGILAGSALLVSMCISAVLVVAHRRDMLVLGILAVAGFMTATGPAMLREPLHTPLATFAMLAFGACAWAVAAGDRWFWPGAVFFGSLATQAQVAFGVPVAVTFIAVCVAAALGAPRRRAAADRRSVKVLATTVAVAVACWAAPLYDQFFASGNLWALFVTGRGGDRVGFGWAVARLAETLAFPPAWTSGDLHLSITMHGDQGVTWHTPPAAWATAACTGALILWGLWRSFRRDQRSRAALGIVVISSLAGCLLASAIIPDEAFSLLGHREIWRVPGLLASWFAVASLADVIVELVPARRRRLLTSMSSLAPLVAVLAVAGACASLTARASAARDTGSVGFGAVEAFTAAVTPSCARGPVVVQATTLVDAPTALGLTAMLSLRGCTVHTTGVDAVLPGRAHAVTGDEPTRVKIDGFGIPPAGCRLLSVYDPGSTSARDAHSTNALDRLQRSGPQYLFRCARSEP